MEKLPVDDYLEIIRQKLQSHSVLVLSASPGAGKTTRVPPALLAKSAGKILVLEPRRMAAVAACHRIAEEQNWTVGNQVGYQVRFENRTSPTTKLIFMTEALLARQMLNDPELKGVDTVVLDEFHERSASVDLTLALLKELQALGSKIKILLMSATLQSQDIANYLDQASILEIPGKLFPLQIVKQKEPQRLRLDNFFFELIHKKIKSHLQRTSNDILVFLPGAGEIKHLVSRLESSSELNLCEIHSLHGRLPLDEQRRVLLKSTKQKIILSTNIAESSVTVDGVDTVIDCGLEKVATWDYRTGFSRLEVQRISLASARQRAGRSARQKEGYCEQLWSAQDELSMSKDRPAEIQRIDLGEILLFLAHHGIRNFQDFDWFQKPDPLRLKSSLNKLIQMEALNSRHELTALGKKILRWPLSPELGVLLARFHQENESVLGAQIVSCLQELDFLKIKPEEHPEGVQWQSDLHFRLAFLNGSLKLDRSEINFSAVERVKESIHSLLRQLKDESSQSSREEMKSPHNQELNREKSAWLKKEILKSWPHRLGRRRESTQRGLAFDGHGVQVAPQSFVKESEYFLVLNGVDTANGNETLITSAIGYSKDEVLEILAEKIQLHEELNFIEEKQEILLSTQRKLGAISLDEPRYQKPTEAQIRELLPQLALKRWALWINANKSLRTFLKRIDFLLHNKNLLPEIAQSNLQDFSFEDWKQKSLEQACYNETSYKNLISKDLYPYFNNNLPAEIRDLLNREIPKEVLVPSGKTHVINYENPSAPTLEVRLQEVFGWSQNPSLLFGKMRLTLSLLAPNYRPVQITQDLNSFWKNAYNDVKKELRSRYPKHSWPDNPLEAIAVAGPRRRK